MVPVWISPHHPLYLHQAIRKRVRREYDRRGIFLNIPYSDRYSNLELAILSTVTAYDLQPRMARERSWMEVRLLKIVELMLTCNYGLTDLSYVKRMNMPLELGLLLGFGKDSFVMSGKRYGALKTISDLNFSDIHYHEGSIRRLIAGLSRWVEQTCSTKRLTTQTLLRRYRRLKEIRERLGEDFDRRTPREIAALLPVARDEFKMILPGT